MGKDWLVIKYGARGKYHILPPYKWNFNPNTPPGEDAIYWEEMKWNGKRYFDYGDIKFRGSEAEAHMFVLEKVTK